MPTDKDLETPTMIRRKLFAKLPEEIQAKAEEIVVRRLHVEVLSTQHEELAARAAAKRSEMQLAADEIVQLETELTAMIKKYGCKENVL